MYSPATIRRYPRRELLRRTSMLGLGAGLATTGVTGCTGQDPPERVTLVRYEDATAGPIWEEVLRAFRREHPDVDVEYENVPASSWSEFFDTVSVRIAGGNVPDVVQVASEGQRLFADRGLAEPIDGLVERDSEELADYFDQVHPNLIQWTNELTTPGERTYYLPVGFNTMAIYYSVEAFDRAGVAEPDEEWTWEEFLETCEELTASLDGGYAMHVDPAYFGGVMPWLLTNGANTLNADWTAPTVDTPEATEAAAFMRDLVRRGLSPQPGGEFDPFTEMSQGRLAMVGGGQWPSVSFGTLDYLDQVRITHWPRNRQPGSPVGWDAYPIMTEASNKEGAWKLVKFLATTEANEMIASLSGATVPPQESVARSESFQENSAENVDVLYDALDYATPVPSPEKGSVFEQDIIDTFTQILAGNEEPEEALATLSDKIEAVLQR